MPANHSEILAKIQGEGKREKRYIKVAQREAFESKQAVLTNEQKEEVPSVLVMPHDEDGGERRGRNNKFLARTHGQVRGDPLYYWTRQDQLETRAGRTQSRRSRLA